MDQPDTVLLYLAWAARHDSENGGDGLRTTREVADHCAMSPSTARRRLWEAANRDEADGYDVGSGTAIEWRITEAGQALVETHRKAGERS